jgi:hypothetical protein
MRAKAHLVAVTFIYYIALTFTSVRLRQANHFAPRAGALGRSTTSSEREDLSVGIREKLNENPAITTGVTIGIIAIAIIFIGWQVFGGSGAGAPITEAYYTTDENATGDAAVKALFTDKADRIPPFDHNGKPAFRAHVFTCDGGKTKWITHLQRFTPEAKKKLEEVQANAGKQPTADNTPGVMEQLYMTGMEVKKPGAGPWVKQSDFQKSSEITAVRCPDGKADNIEAVLP